MSIIYVLIPIAILLTALGIYLFFWAVKTDQFEDLESKDSVFYLMMIVQIQMMKIKTLPRTIIRKLILKISLNFLRDYQ